MKRWHVTGNVFHGLRNTSITEIQVFNTAC
jgi:hypothetical protein